MKAALAALALAASLAPGPAARWDWGEAKDDYTGMAESKAICRQVKGREPPAADRPTAAEAAALKGCDSEKLYYGIGMPADPVKARKCAFLEAEGEETVFGGRTMLMMVYANGRGARQDYDVAIHLACGIEGAPAESDGRVRDLADRRKRGDRDGDFDFCEDITSGLAMGYCAGHVQTVEEAKREAAWTRLTAAWSPAEKQALAKARAAHKAFAEAHASGELDLSGTARGAIAIEAEERLAKALLATVEALEQGRAPTFGHGDFVAADAALNAAYRKELAAAVPNSGPGAPTREGIREAERAWIAYRDAFLAFAALRYPKLPRESVAAWLTKQRIESWSAGQE